MTHQPELVTELTVFDKHGRVKQVRTLRPQFQLQAQIELTTRDRKGRVCQQFSFPMRSFVKNWPSQMLAKMGNGTEVSVRVTGDERDIEFQEMFVTCAAAQDNSGIWAGTDDGSILPLAPANYTLGAKIAHGTGAGQLSYSEVAFSAPAADGDDFVYQVYRTFANSSGGTITVQEAGLVGSESPGVGAYKHLLARDLNDEDGDPINAAVADTQSLEIRYKWKITQAAGWVKNYLITIESTFENKDVTVTDITGATPTFNYSFYGNTWDTMAAANDGSYGVVVGTGSGALDAEDYALGTKIAHGAGC